MSNQTNNRVEELRIELRLEELRVELRAERISQGELIELQGLAEHIDPGDVELLEAAGVPEFPPPMLAVKYMVPLYVYVQGDKVVRVVVDDEREELVTVHRSSEDQEVLEEVTDAAERAAAIAVTTAPGHVWPAWDLGW